MLKKLLRYDMMSVWRLWWIGAVIVPIAAVVGALMMRLLNYLELHEISPEFANSFLQAMAGFVLFASIIALVLSFVLTMVLVYMRFYKNLFTDEGYLTFTLPVSRKQILLSKTLNAFIWYVLHSSLIFIAIFIFLLIAPNAEPGGSIINIEVIYSLGEFFIELWNEIGGWSLLIGFEFVVWNLVGIVPTIVLIELSITVGAIVAKKAKVVASIAIYYLLNGLISFLGQIFLVLCSFGVFPYLTYFAEMETTTEVCSLVSYALIMLIAITGIIAMVLYNLTQYLLERKLNLA